MLLSACSANLLGNNGYSASSSSRSFAYNGAMDTRTDLIAYLESQGHDVKDTGPSIHQTFFTVQGRQITVDGAEVQVYEYPTGNAAESEAGNISADGTTVGTTKVTWLGTPHFFQDGNLIVLYLGNDSRVLLALENALGAQIAGGLPESSSSSGASSKLPM